MKPAAISRRAIDGRRIHPGSRMYSSYVVCKVVCSRSWLRYWNSDKDVLGLEIKIIYDCRTWRMGAESEALNKNFHVHGWWDGRGNHVINNLTWHSLVPTNVSSSPLIALKVEMDTWTVAVLGTSGVGKTNLLIQVCCFFSRLTSLLTLVPCL